MYEKHNWVNGEVISEDKLNHMEEGISTGGGIYTYGETVLFDSEVRFDAPDSGFPSEGIALQGELPKSDINVTFNGQNYILPYGYIEGPGDYWGEVADNVPSFTNFPLFIYHGYTSFVAMTSNAGLYSLKISANILELDSSFESILPKTLFVNVSPVQEVTDAYVLDKTYSEINSAVLNGDNIRFLLHGSGVPTKEFYFDSIFDYNGSLALNLFTAVISSGTTITFENIQFKYTDDNGYPTNYSSDGTNS